MTKTALRNRVRDLPGTALRNRTTGDVGVVIKAVVRGRTTRIRVQITPDRTEIWTVGRNTSAA